MKLPAMPVRPMALSALALLLAAPALSAPASPAGWVPQVPTIDYAGGVRIPMLPNPLVTGFQVTVTGPEKVTCKQVDIQVHVSEEGFPTTGFVVLPTFCANVFDTSAWTVDMIQDQPADAAHAADVRVDAFIDAKKKNGKKIRYTVELRANTYATRPTVVTVTGKAGSSVTATIPDVLPVVEP